MSEQIGVRVRVTLSDRTLIEGWLYGENPLGIYVSLDPSGRHIRYVPSGDLTIISYDNAATRTSFARDRDVEAVEKAERFNEDLSEAVIERFSRVDYNRVRRVALRFRTQRYQLDHIEPDPVYAEHSYFEIPPDLVFRLADNYADLLDEIERSNLETILIEYSDRIADFVSTDTLPLLEGEVGERRDKDEVRELIMIAKQKNQISQTRSGREPLEKITPESVIPAETIERDQQALTTLSPTDRDQIRARRMRKIAVLGKVALGGALAATNVTLGITAGVVTALPTLGVGTVGAAAGLVASTFTGFNAACDGLKDYASILESD